MVCEGNEEDGLKFCDDNYFFMLVQPLSVYLLMLTLTAVINP